ncbi:MAG: response regulator, partial [Clostridia bacterium]|nr:response regulator [Clostridia bacterium]
MVNVLIVDDDIYYAKNLMNIINTKNNTVRVCNICINGKEALNIINTINDIDVIVLDLQMPIYNGMYLLNALPEEKYKESIIVISGDNELVSRLRNSKKIFTYINKLYDMEKIELH